MYTVIPEFHNSGMLQFRNSGIPRFRNSGIREFRKGQSKRKTNEKENASSNLVFRFSVVVSSVGLFPPRFVKKHEKNERKRELGQRPYLPATTEGGQLLGSTGQIVGADRCAQHRRAGPVGESHKKKIRFLLDRELILIIFLCGRWVAFLCFFLYECRWGTTILHPFALASSSQPLGSLLYSSLAISRG